MMTLLIIEDSYNKQSKEINMRTTLTSRGYPQGILGVGDLVLDAWGRQKVTNDYSIFHALFTEDVSELWLRYIDGVETPNGNGIASENGMLKVTSSNNEVICQSKRNPRYQPNRGLLYSSSMILCNTDSIIDFGLGNAQNGVFFRCKNGVLYAVRRYRLNGVVSEVENTITNLPKGYDLTKGNIYDIQMQWRGVGNIKFFIGDEASGASKLVYTMRLLNTLDNLSISNPAMPIMFRCKSLTEDAILYCGCVDVSSEGGYKENRQLGLATSTDEVSLSNGVETPVLALRVNRFLLNGSINTRDNALRRILFFSNVNSVITAYYTRDSSLFDGTVWSYNDTMQRSSYSSGDDIVVDPTLFTLPKFEFRRLLANTTEEINNPDEDYGEFYLTAGDYLVLAIKPKGGSALGGGTIEWGEEI